MVAFCSFALGSGASERERIIRYNAEHSEQYWIQAWQNTESSHVIVLIDCRDPVGRTLADQLAGPRRVSDTVRNCESSDTIPTLHASLPCSAALKVFSSCHPGFIPYVLECPDDQFVVWCVAAGGSSLAYRPRPCLVDSHSLGQ